MPKKLDLPLLDDGLGPAPPMADEHARRMVAEAVERAFAQHGLLRGRWYGKWALVLAATLVVGAAAASSALTALRRRSPPVAPEAAVSHPTANLAPEIATGSPPRAEPPEDTTASSDEAAAAAGLPENTPAVRSSSHPRPDDLLRIANGLRAARRWKAADRAYERVLAVHPGSPEAYAATVAAADLRLEQLGDARGALRLYRSAQQKNPQGSLAEQVLWGMARCDASLGDREGERRWLQEYVSRYPAGLFLPEARSRLAELSASAP